MDFRNLNRSSLKDNYPLPNIDQFFTESGWCSKDVNDRWISRYNNIVVHPDERET